MAKELLVEISIWQEYHHHHFYHAIKNAFNTETVVNAFKLIGNGIRTNFTESTKWPVQNFISRYCNDRFFVTFSCLSKKNFFLFEIAVVDILNVKTKSMIIYFHVVLSWQNTFEFKYN